MFFFPLAIVAGVIAARFWPLWRAIGLGTFLFVIAVLVAWRAQGFTPSVRDLLWLALVILATWVSSRNATRNASTRD